LKHIHSKTGHQAGTRFAARARGICLVFDAGGAIRTAAFESFRNLAGFSGFKAGQKPGQTGCPPKYLKKFRVELKIFRQIPVS